MQKNDRKIAEKSITTYHDVYTVRSFMGVFR